MPKLSDIRHIIWRYAQRPGPSTLNTGLVASWPLDDIGTVDRQDYGGDEYDLTNNNGATNATGDIGTVFRWFNDQFLNTDNAAAPNLYGSATDPFSVAVSFKVLSWPVTSGLITPICGIPDFSGTRSWLVGVLPDTVSPARGATFHTSTDGTGGGTLRIDGPIIELNTWVNYVARYDGTQYKLQVDGVDSTPVANASGFLRPTSVDFTVARMINTNTDPIYGDIVVRNLTIWNKALSDAEVDEWYNNGNPLYIPFLV